MGEWSNNIITPNCSTCDFYIKEKRKIINHHLLNDLVSYIFKYKKITLEELKNFIKKYDI